jgi:hypothetical protein
LSVQGDTVISSATSSTSPVTGAFTVTGGVGIAGNLFVGGSVNFSQATFNNLTVTGAVLNTPASSTQIIQSSTVSTEANPRYYVDGTGKMYYGSGGASSVYDVQISRSAVNSLAITGNTSITGTLSSTGVASFASISSSGTITIAGSATIGGGVTSTGTFTGNYSGASVLLQSNLNSAAIFSINSSGLMTWNNTPMSMVISADPDYFGSPVFTALNSNGNIAFKNGASSITSGVGGNFVYKGTHQFNNGLNSLTDISSNSSIKVKNSGTGYTQTSIDQASISLYNSTGVASSTLSVGGVNLLNISGGVSIQNALSSASISTTSLTSSGRLATTSPSLTIDRTAVGGIQPNAGIQIVNGTSSNSYLQTNTTDTGWVLSNTTYTGALQLLGTANSSTSTISAAGTTSRTWNMPDTSGTVVLQNSIDVLSNKVIADIQMGSSSVSLNQTNTPALPVTGVSSVIINSAISGATISGLSESLFRSSSSKLVILTNNSNVNLLLLNNNSASAAGDRIVTVDGNDVILPVNSSIQLNYNTSASKWIQVNRNSERIAIAIYQNFTNIIYNSTTSAGSGVNYTQVVKFDTPLNTTGTQIPYNLSSGEFTAPFSGICKVSVRGALYCDMTSPFSWDLNLLLTTVKNGVSSTVSIGSRSKYNPSGPTFAIHQGEVYIESGSTFSLVFNLQVGVNSSWYSGFGNVASPQRPMLTMTLTECVRS